MQDVFNGEWFKLIDVEESTCKGCYFHNCSTQYVNEDGDQPCSVDCHKRQWIKVEEPMKVNLIETETSEGSESSSISALDKQEGGNHYKVMKIQPIEYAHANKLGMLEGNVIKYVSRHKLKDKEKDIRKAIHSLELILELEYGQVK